MKGESERMKGTEREREREKGRGKGGGKGGKKDWVGIA